LFNTVSLPLIVVSHADGGLVVASCTALVTGFVPLCVDGAPRY